MRLSVAGFIPKTLVLEFSRNNRRNAVVLGALLVQGVRIWTDIVFRRAPTNLSTHSFFGLPAGKLF